MVREYRVNRNIANYIRATDKKPSAVADRAGIRRDTFSRILHCKRPVYADEVDKIATAIGLPLEDLFRDVEDDKTQDA